jgi:RNA polymerase sigma factor FliA
VECISASPEAVAELQHLVRIIAGRVYRTRPADAAVEMSDLIQAGTVGLLQAARSFQPASGVPLSGYAKFRIRGEMLDVVRKARIFGPPGSSSLKTRNSEDGESLEFDLAASPETSPMNALERKQRRKILVEELRRLPPKYRAVVRMRYSRELTLSEIGSVLKVNESRACQIHSSALKKLRKALRVRGIREGQQIL